MKPDLNLLFVGFSLTAACVLFVQVRAIDLFQTLAGSDFSREAQSERERTFLAQFKVAPEPSYWLDPPDWLSGVGQSPTETLLLESPHAFAWRDVIEEAEQRRPRIPANPLFASDLDTRTPVTMAGPGDAQ